MIVLHEAAIDNARRQAIFYRSLGYQPLPSRMDKKAPALASFADYWEKPIKDTAYSKESWRTTNIQLMTGYHWRLCVVDCDGAEAIQVFKEMSTYHGGYPDTWSSRTGGGGLHLYFTIPAGISECPSRRLWGQWDTWAGTNTAKPGSPMKGNWAKHKEVRILGDHSLVIAPPSFHVETEKRYKWITGPDQIRLPAEAPAWLLEMEAIQNPTCIAPVVPASIAYSGPSRPTARRYNWKDVLDAIPSKIDVAVSWGLRFASVKPNAQGWCKVHAIDRDDAAPSASFSANSGRYWDGIDGAISSLFELGCALGHFACWQDCCNALGARLLGS